MFTKRTKKINSQTRKNTRNSPNKKQLNHREDEILGSDHKIIQSSRHAAKKIITRLKNPCFKIIFMIHKHAEGQRLFLGWKQFFYVPNIWCRLNCDFIFMCTQLFFHKKNSVVSNEAIWMNYDSREGQTQLNPKSQ